MMVRYIHLRIVDLPGPRQNLVIGPVEDDVLLKDFFDVCLRRIARSLSEKDRSDSRHFWHNHRLLAFGDRRIGEIESGTNIALELRPDYYGVVFSRNPLQVHAIDPETTVGEAMCAVADARFEMATRALGRLDPARSFVAQGVLPSGARPVGEEATLYIRFKPAVWATPWALGTLAFALAMAAAYLAAAV